MRAMRLIVVALVVTTVMVQIPVEWSVAAQDEGGSQQDNIVNLELILDSSGSMAEIIDTGETRMEAAKRILLEVIESIPEREDVVNVGLRIYGHKGNNSEEAKAESCEASDLLVPIAGVNKEALRDAVEQAQPTGWTPLHRSLVRAARDFPDGGEGVTNAAVLVTDGIETCGGNPCRVAGELRAGQVQLITHVIGFAVTSEDQEALSCIAESGGGRLFGAGSAAELRDALFSVLEELNIIVGTGYVGGNAFSLLPAGNIGELAVVAVGAYDSLTGSLPFLVRNNTGGDVVGLKVSVTVRDSAGSLLAAGDGLLVNPYYVRAGGVAFGMIYLGGAELPGDAVFEFDVEPAPVSEARFSILADLDIVEASLFEDRIVGTVENRQDAPIDGPIFLGAVCFDLDGNLLNHNLGTLDINRIDPGETASFQITLFSFALTGAGCPAFLVAGSGFGSSPAPSSQASRPTPTPEADSEEDASGDSPDSAGDDSFSLPGLEDAALRNFEPSGTRTEGLLSLGFIVARFRSEELADAGVEGITDRFLENRRQDTQSGVDFSDVRPTSAPRIGDRAIAFGGVINSQGIDFDFAVLAIRHGDLVYLMTAFGRASDPLMELANIASVVVSDSERPAATGGLRTGGLWDLLPTLEEVPFGFAVYEEKVPEEFGPVPAPE